MPDARSRRTFEAFCDLTLPKPEWTHEAHLVVCRVALSTRTRTATVDFLRDAIRSYNEATGVENSTSSGYHETLTRYFVGAVASLDGATLPEVLRARRCTTSAPLRHWSRELLFSPAARAEWVEPDLASLPWASDGLLRQSEPEGGSLRSAHGLRDARIDSATAR